MTTHRFAIAALFVAASAAAHASPQLTAAPRADGKVAVIVMPSVTKLPTPAGPVPIPYPSWSEPRTTPVPQQSAPVRPLPLLPMPVRTSTP